MGIAWPAWRLLLRRALSARRSLVLVLALATFTAVFALTLSSTVARSSTPRGDELSQRLLGPYELRVQGEDEQEAGRLARQAAAGGLAPDTVLLTTTTVITPTSAATANLEAGEAGTGLWESRFTLLEGTWPADSGQAAVTRDLATVLGLHPGDRVQMSKSPVTVSAIVQERANHGSRVVLLRSDPHAVPIGDPSRTTWAVYVGGGSAEQVASARDAYARAGYGVFGRSGGDMEVVVSDGEFVGIMKALSWGLVVLGAGALALAVRMTARALRRDLGTLALLGFDARHEGLLLTFFVVLGMVPAVVLGVAGGFMTAVATRPWFEAANNTSWYSTRMDPRVLLVGLGAIGACGLISAFVSTFGVQTRLRLARVPGDVVARGFGLAGVVVAIVSVTTREWSVLVAAALALGPWAAMTAWRALQWLAARRAAGARGGDAGLLIATSLRHPSATGPAAAGLTAGFVVAPLCLAIVVAGISGSSDPTSPVVPRPTTAVYTGGASFSSAELEAAAKESGAVGLGTWNLATIPIDVEGATANVPALPQPGQAACAAPHEGAAADGAEDLCGPGLRGVGVASPSTLALLLGRELTPDERAFVDSGGALALDRRMLDGDRLRLVPPGGPADSSGPLSVRARLVVPASGTVVSTSTPTVWVSPTARPATGVGRGQVQAVFEFTSPVTPEIEQRVRRALATRLPVDAGEEFLVTHLDATRINLAQRLLARVSVVSLVLTLLVTLMTSLAFRRAHGHQLRALRDLGAPGGLFRIWHATTMAAVATVGCAAAALVSGAVAAAIVYGELGRVIPVADLAALWPVLGIPFVVFLVGYAWSPQRTGSAWATSFGQE